MIDTLLQNQIDSLLINQNIKLVEGIVKNDKIAIAELKNLNQNYKNLKNKIKWAKQVLKSNGVPNFSNSIVTSEYFEFNGFIKRKIRIYIYYEDFNSIPHSQLNGFWFLYQVKEGYYLEDFNVIESINENSILNKFYRFQK